MLRTSHTAVLVAAFALLTATAQAEPVWVSFDGTPEPMPPTVGILSADANHAVYDIQVHGMLVSDTVVEGVTYQRLSFPGEGALSDEGLPELPYVCRYVGYAPNASTVLAAGYLDEVELWNYQVFPAQPVNPWTYPPWPPPEFVLDSATYASEGPFPDYPLEFLLDTLGVWRDLELALVGVIPFHYYPAEGRLVVHTHVVLTVSFAGGEGLPPEVAESRHQAYLSLVPNFPGLGISAMPHGVTKDKLVIVLGDNSPELRAAIEPLRVWKTLRGLDVFTPAVGNEIPSSCQYAIRNHLAAHYSPYHETAVLLIGDDSTIPAPDDWGVMNSAIGRRFPGIQLPAHWPLKMGSNTWYSVRGEHSFENLLVGRLASADPDTVASYAEKVMRYERSIDEQWWNERLLFVIGIWDARKHKQDILDLMPPGLHILQADGGVHGNERIVGVLQDSGVGTVNFFGHGDIGGIHWSSSSGHWTRDDAYGLSNQSWPPVVYSMACANGFIRNRYGPREGLAEAWTENPNGGAIGVAAVSGYGISGWLDSQDLLMCRNPRLASNLPPSRSRYWVGENFQEAKVAARGRSPLGMYTYLALHWFGDPTVNVWSCFRGDLQVEFAPPAILPGVPTTIQATVLDTLGDPVEGAWVGLYKPGAQQPELLWSQPTDAGGTVQFLPVVIPTAGTILVSAFKDWYKPAEGHIAVTPAVILPPIAFDTITGPNRGRMLSVEPGTGNVHLVCGDGENVHYIRSSDGGESWEETLVLDEGRSPALALDWSGLPAVSYLRNDTVFLSRRQPDQSWLPTVVFAGNGADMPGPAALAAGQEQDGTGYLSCAFPVYNQIQNRSQVWLARVDGAGTTLTMVAETTGAMADSLVSVANTFCGPPHVAWQRDDEVWYWVEPATVALPGGGVIGPGGGDVSPGGGMKVADGGQPFVETHGDLVYLVWLDDQSAAVTAALRHVWAPEDAWVFLADGISVGAAAQPVCAQGVYGWQEPDATGTGEIRADAEGNLLNLSNSPGVHSAWPHLDVLYSYDPADPWSLPFVDTVYAFWTEAVEGDSLYEPRFGKQSPAGGILAGGRDPTASHTLIGGQERPSFYARHRTGYRSNRGIAFDYGADSLSYELAYLDPRQEYLAELVFARDPGRALELTLESRGREVARVELKTEGPETLRVVLPDWARQGTRLGFGVKERAGGTAVLAGLKLYPFARSRPPKGGALAQPGPERLQSRLYGCVPNPLSRNTVIRYQLARPGRAGLRVYDAAGRLVKTLVDGEHQPGVHRATWNGTDNHGRRVAHGVYFYRLDGPDISETKQMVLLR